MGKDIRKNLKNLDENLRGAGSEVRKGARISKSNADEFISVFADLEKIEHPELSQEQCEARAMKALPNLSAIQAGYPQEVVQAWGQG